MWTTFLSFVINAVDAWNFIAPFAGSFAGSFAGQFYDEPSPPKTIFPNSHSCDAFEEFITNTILERVANGSLVFWGAVDAVDPPHLVMPITIAPTKPPMCHDERFLNLWIKDLPFITLITYQTFLDTLAQTISRRFVMTKVVTTMCLLHPSVARYLVYHGKTVISHNIPLSLLAGRQALLFTIPLG